ncbi:MAG: histone-like protein, partial [Halobacteria archaeon]|nr:histone-like protein [Halobacteria archaeon]
MELPLAPVDSLIREADSEIRVSSGAAEALALRIEDKGASVAEEASERADEDGRKTIMPGDFGFTAPEVTKEDLT